MTQFHKSGVTVSLLSRLEKTLPQTVKRENHDDMTTVLSHIRRDLETLLNTKRSDIPISHKRPWVNQSIIQFGMPDFMNLNFAQEQGQFQLCQLIKQTIELFEPRIHDVMVFIESETVIHSTLSVTIQGNIKHNNQHHECLFESLLDPDQQYFSLNSGKAL